MCCGTCNCSKESPSPKISMDFLTEDHIETIELHLEELSDILPEDVFVQQRVLVDSYVASLKALCVVLPDNVFAEILNQIEVDALQRVSV